jgi:hypothetical protein
MAQEVVEAVAVLKAGVAVCREPVPGRAKKSDCRHGSGYLQSSRDLSDSNLPQGQENLCWLAILG